MELKEYIDSLDSNQKKNCYGLAISAIHKAIRMCRPDMVVAPTRVAYLASNYRFKHRMMVALTEDCVRDYELVEWASENFFRCMSSMSGSLEFNTKMCESPKGKEGNFLRCACNPYDENEIQRNFNSKYVKLMVPEDLFYAYKIDVPVENMIAAFKEKGYEVPEWMEKFMLICYKDKFDNEKQGMFLPFLYHIDERKTLTDTYDLYSDGANDTFDDLFLLNCIDFHTYVGKIALGIGKKKGMFDFCKNESIFNEVVWHLMPGSYRNILKQKDGFCLTKTEKEMYVNEEVSNAWKGVYNDFNSLRKWAVNKFAPEYIEACKMAINYSGSEISDEDFIKKEKKEEQKEDNKEMEFDFK